jgi:hypothetical protein
MPRKKKLDELTQAHGKQEVFEPQTLDQIWGDTGLSKYKTFDEQVYASGLAEMNRADLQAHAVTVGLIPIDNRDILTQRLVREFKKHVSSYQKVPVRQATGKVSNEIINILSEGR